MAKMSEVGVREFSNKEIITLFLDLLTLYYNILRTGCLFIGLAKKGLVVLLILC